MSPLISGVTVHCRMVLSLPIRLLTQSLCAVATAISPLTATLNVCVCVCIHPCATTTMICVCVCVCVISSSLLHSFFVKAIGDQWRLKVTNHPSSSPHSTLQLATSSCSLPHLSLYWPRRQPPGAPVSFIFGAMAPADGLQGIRGSGGQLLLCFNWHYHFSSLTKMDHPAGPRYCRYRSRGTEQWEEGRRGRRCRPGGHDEKEDKGMKKM